MPLPISPSLPIAPPSRDLAASKATQPASFTEALQSAVDRVELSSRAANKSVESFLAGDSEDLHTVGLAAQRADLEFEMFMQVRNKVVQAYQEIMKMQM